LSSGIAQQFTVRVSDGDVVAPEANFDAIVLMVNSLAKEVRPSRTLGVRTGVRHAAALGAGITGFRLESGHYFPSPNSYHIAFNTPNAKAKESPRIQLKYHMQDS
jgi:hypothetical protein